MKHTNAPVTGQDKATTSDEPIKTNPSKQQADPLQVLVQPVDDHKAKLNQSFPQNRVDAQGKRYSDAVGPSPATADKASDTKAP